MTDFLTHNVSSRSSSIVSLLAVLLFLPFLLFGAYQTVILVSRAAGVLVKDTREHSIVVDSKTSLEPITTDFFHAFAQGGEEASDMLAPVMGEVKALRPKLIRLDHIYDHYDVVSRAGDSLAFDFSRLDGAVNTIVATGAKPVLALSFMPSAIAKDGIIINPPNNWDEWALTVQRTIEHFSGKGERNLGGVYYEVWNEPDLAQFGSWKTGGEKSYLQLYRYASIGAKNASGTNQFFLGGPSTTGLYKNWILSLLTSGNRVDFLAWHSYLLEPSRFEQDQRNLISWLLPYPNYTLIPKLITEAGFTGAKDKRYGTTFSAAHLAATVRQLISGRPAYVFSFQLKDGPGQEDGSGWGLLTHESNGKRPKPRYGIYNFLDPMAGTRLPLSGEGTWVTGFGSLGADGVVRILLVNFDAYGSHTEAVPVTVNNLDPGTYTINHLTFRGASTSKKQLISGTSFTTTITMPTQSVMILELLRAS